MPASLRSTALAACLVLAGLLGGGAPPARAQAYGPAPLRYYYPAPTYQQPAPVYYQAPVAYYPPLASYQSPIAYYPAPTYQQPAPVYQYPAPPSYSYSYPNPSQVASGPYVEQRPRSYSVYDANGVEYDIRHPHWSFDYNDWVARNIK